MSGTGDKLKGIGNEAKGKVKRQLGRDYRNRRLAAEGEADVVKGKTQRVAGTVKNAVADIKATVKH